MSTARKGSPPAAPFSESARGGRYGAGESLAGGVGAVGAGSAAASGAVAV